MKILFATPHYDVTCYVIFTYALLETEWPPGATVEIAKSIGNTASQALEGFAEIALDSGCDYLVQSCNDSAWPKDAVKRLIANDKDVVSGWSRGRFHPFRVKAFTGIDRENVRMRHKPRAEIPGKGLERVYSIAGELAAFKVDVFRRMKRPWFSGVLRPDGTTTTDDFAFGCRAFDAGVEIWLDWDLPLVHHAGGMVTDGSGLRSMA